MRTRVVDSDSTLIVTAPTVIRSPERSGCTETSRSPFKKVPLREPRSSTVRAPSVSLMMRACWRDSILSATGRSLTDERPIVTTGRSSMNFWAGMPGPVR